ncbi:MAG: hypothetical protein IPJ69_00780 [Deltaproteobacteria bacterium]|nr:MAG: hypothetical protein IPJ69_00780 [Deltaproteobacteria bacterium]
MAGLQGMGSLAWHDDQLGTSLVTAAAVITSLKIQGKFSKEAISQLRIVIAGAGAAGIACGRTLRSAFRRLCPEFRDDQIIMTDSKGVLRTSRTDLSDEKREFAVNTDKRSVSDVIHGADVFIGVTTAGTLKLSEDDIRAMNPKPIIFCLANPDPEALPELIDSVRDDAICGTGRSDVKNQANNAGAFPGVLAGGLDVGAETLNLDMIVDAAFALAEIPFQSVPHDLQSLYGYELIPGHRDYATASAFDPRAHFAVARAVARRAHLSGLATFDFSAREAMYGPWFLENRLPHGLLKGSAALLGF